RRLSGIHASAIAAAGVLGTMDPGSRASPLAGMTTGGWRRKARRRATHMAPGAEHGFPRSRISLRSIRATALSPVPRAVIPETAARRLSGIHASAIAGSGVPGGMDPGSRALPSAGMTATGMAAEGQGGEPPDFHRGHSG